MRRGWGSACGPAALTPQAPVLLALSQQQHQQAVSLASIMRNLWTVAQIHHTESLLEVKQRLSLCFIAFSQLILDKDGVCEQLTSTQRLACDSSSASRSHKNNNNTGQDLSQVGDQDQRRLKVALMSAHTHAETHKRTISALLPDCSRHLGPVVRGEPCEKED